MTIIHFKTDLLKVIFISILAGFSLIFFLDTASAQEDQFRDTENCMLCHRYPTIGKFGKAGEMRIFYIYGDGYASSVHGGRKCTQCHQGLDRIPHKDVKKVDCSIECHIQGKSSRKVVSHAEVVEKYKISVHGSGPKLDPKPFPEDLPACTYCHDNRDSYMGTESSGDEGLFDVLRGKTGLKRSQRDVINLCASCHGDEDKMARHGVESIKTFKDTFHWQAIKYGVKNAPDCISCHVPAGYSSHAIPPGTDILSPVYIDNRQHTCSVGGGGQTCHPDATHAFAEGRVHKYGAKAQLLSGEKVNMEGRFKSLMAEQARADIPAEELFHYKVLEAISLIYKILIGCTIGFMSLHQLLDYRKARKKGRTFK
ncbi:MAG: hypothetical protein ISR97_01080 [Nitrospira sp.]|nr:hypothetical protein [Nitrospira sp.]